MKKRILIYSAGLTALLVCCKSGPEKKLAEANTRNENNIITFKVAGAPVKTSGWNIGRFDMGKGLNLNITTNMHEEKRTVTLNLRGCTTGTYSLDEGASGPLSGYGNYKPDYEDLLTSFRFVQGSFVINGLDTANGLLNATFSGRVKKGDDEMEITDGRILNGSLNKNIQTY